eukprot:2685445-Amphidinium_carterae.1
MHHAAQNACEGALGTFDEGFAGAPGACRKSWNEREALVLKSAGLLMFMSSNESERVSSPIEMQHLQATSAAALLAGCCFGCGCACCFGCACGCFCCGGDCCWVCWGAGAYALAKACATTANTLPTATTADIWGHIWPTQQALHHQAARAMHITRPMLSLHAAPISLAVESFRLQHHNGSYEFLSRRPNQAFFYATSASPAV